MNPSLKEEELKKRRMVLVVWFIFMMMSTAVNAIDIDQSKLTVIKQNVELKQEVKVQKVIFAIASYYAWEFQRKRMANGERFDANDPTIVAHKSLPFGTILRITNPKNGKSILGIVKDRGPYCKGRDIDLSLAGARLLGIVSAGVASVKIEVLTIS